MFIKEKRKVRYSMKTLRQCNIFSW